MERICNFIQCSRCGYFIDGDEKRCTSCGALLEGESIFLRDLVLLIRHGKVTIKEVWTKLPGTLRAELGTAD